MSAEKSYVEKYLQKIKGAMTSIGVQRKAIAHPIQGRLLSLLAKLQGKTTTRI